VVISGATRRAIREHAEADAPNEACGLLVLREGIADRYVPGINEAASPYRFELRMPDPEIWFLEDEGLELAVVHSHVSAPPRPSRTDVENIGHWQGRPYVIYTLRTDELAAWQIEDGSIEPLPLTES
jgi:proteasome lid subunit RPN8/RPN11